LWVITGASAVQAQGAFQFWGKTGTAESLKALKALKARPPCNMGSQTFSKFTFNQRLQRFKTRICPQPEAHPAAQQTLSKLDDGVKINGWFSKG